MPLAGELVSPHFHWITVLCIFTNQCDSHSVNHLDRRNYEAIHVVYLVATVSVPPCIRDSPNKRFIPPNVGDPACESEDSTSTRSRDV
ncbi:hypothetical protein [Klebsiella phage pKP-BM327-1.2]|nr:hypothetical protein [Klebsiella phage pKP-BM327-1.2]